MEISQTRQALAAIGFVHPSGEESAITWMDFDGDGNCGLTATVGAGGMRSIERMMFFRGLGEGRFRLVGAFATDMEAELLRIPYIPVRIAGERLPALIVIGESQGFFAGVTPVVGLIHAIRDSRKETITHRRALLAEFLKRFAERTPESQARRSVACLAKIKFPKARSKPFCRGGRPDDFPALAPFLAPFPSSQPKS